MRVPHVVADEAKLAIVFTDFFLSFFLFLLRLLLFTYFGDTQEANFFSSPHIKKEYLKNIFFLHISSSYAKILGEKLFHTREIPRSGSKAEDGERKRD